MVVNPPGDRGRPALFKTLQYFHYLLFIGLPSTLKNGSRSPFSALCESNRPHCDPSASLGCLPVRVAPGLLALGKIDSNLDAVRISGEAGAKPGVLGATQSRGDLLALPAKLCSKVQPAWCIVATVSTNPRGFTRLSNLPPYWNGIPSSPTHPWKIGGRGGTRTRAFSH